MQAPEYGPGDGDQGVEDDELEGKVDEDGGAAGGGGLAEDVADSTAAQGKCGHAECAAEETGVEADGTGDEGREEDRDEQADGKGDESGDRVGVGEEAATEMGVGGDIEFVGDEEEGGDGNGNAGEEEDFGAATGGKGVVDEMIKRLAVHEGRLPNYCQTVMTRILFVPDAAHDNRRFAGKPSMNVPEQTLFGIEEPAPVHARVSGPVAAVALEDSLDKLLDYSIPSKLVTRIFVGQRVKVPLGKRNRPVMAYVVAIKEGSDYPRVKDLIEIEDERVLVTPGLLELARWMSRYYCAPLGTVLESVIPAAVKKRIGMGYVQMVRLNKTREEVQELFEKNKAKKRRAILARLLRAEPGEAIELVRLAREAGATPPTVRKLAGLGVISIKAEADVNWMEGEGSGVRVQGSGEAVIPELNEDQRRVYDDLSPRVVGGGFSVNLLFGVTGSGKTEIYLRCIKEVVERGRQAIVLVPEIALTPQTVRRFTARFGRVAVLHSGLSASQRHRFWQQCASGRADVVVGARSAVFAPVPKGWG